jgi:hypothetical protein
MPCTEGTQMNEQFLLLLSTDKMVQFSIRPCLLLGYLRGWEGIISYPGISPIGCLLVRVLWG